MFGYSFVQVVKVSLLDLWAQVMSILPNILGALLIVIIGLLIAPILGGLVRQLVNMFKIDALAQKMGVMEMMADYSPKFSIATLIGNIVKWFFILAFIMAGAEVVHLDRITDFLNEIVLFIPQVVIAIIILVFGVIAGKFFEAIVVRSLKGTKAPVGNPEMLGHLTRWAFIIFAGLAALIQVGIAPTLIEILFAGVVLTLALAFGLGGRDKASQILDRLDGTKKSK